MGNLLDGQAIAAKLREDVKASAERFRAAHGRAPGLTVVLVGEDPASVVYTRNKEKTAKETAIAGSLHKLPEATTEKDLVKLLAELNADDAIDGILVQFPVPKHIRQEAVLDALDPRKDVDGLTAINAGMLASGRVVLAPCTPVGCMHLLRHTGVPLKGARAVVLGRSNLVGKPMAQLLLGADATVTIAHSRTKDLPGLAREADVLVVAVGRARMVRGDWVKEGAVVIDVGMNRDENGKLCGDVAFDEVMAKASWATPVPRGVGPMTIACLLENTVKAAELRIAAKSS